MVFYRSVVDRVWERVGGATWNEFIFFRGARGASVAVEVPFCVVLLSEYLGEDRTGYIRV